MGMIADQLRARLAEMHARHAESDRVTAELQREADAARDALNASYTALMAELAD